jgi:hypothetical protein
MKAGCCGASDRIVFYDSFLDEFSENTTDGLHIF